jgi:DNA-binding CsgD family transcriptional regulator
VRPSTEDVTGLYGRRAELARIDNFLDDASSRPVALFVEGPAGIGKTTLWGAGVRLAVERGWTVLTCRPVESEVPLSFSALGDLMEGVPPAAFAGLPPPLKHALDVALLAADPGPEPPDQRALAVALLGVLRELVSAGPVLIGVDDLQWVDRPTAAVLEYALRRLQTEPASLLATVTASDLLDPMAGLRSSLPQERTRSLEVGPLDREALRATLHDKGSGVRRWLDVVAIYEASGGNPLFAIELAEAMVPPDRRAGDWEPLPIPKSMRPLVQRQLAGLSEAGSRIALVVAASASPTVDLLLSVFEDAAEVTAALSAAEAVGVLHVHDGSVRFNHPVLRSLHYARATDGQRGEAHHRLAVAAADDETRVRHLALATTPPDVALAAKLSAAAELSYRRGAAITGAELADLAVRFTPPAPSNARIERLVEAGKLHFAALDHQGARSRLETAIQLSEPGPARADALHSLARVVGYAAGTLASIPMLRQALQEADDGSLRQARVHCDLGFVMTITTEGFSRASAEHFSAAMHIAERVGDDGLIAQLTAFRAVTAFVAGHGVRRDLIASALEERAPAGRVAMELRPRVVVSHILRSSDDLDGARGLLAKEYSDASETGAESDLPFVLMHLVALETWAGRLDLAKSYADHGYQVAAAADAVTQLACMRSALATIQAYTGPLPEARSEAEAAVDLGLRSGVYLAVALGAHALGLMELVSGNLAAAHAALGAITRATADRHIVDPGWLLARPLADDIESLIRLGELDSAEALLEDMERRAQATGRVWALAAGARCRGLLMSTAGDHQAAALALEQAFAAHERLAMPLELARTHLVAGEIARRGRQKAMARDHLVTAQTMFATRGARLWAERAAAESERLGTRRGDGADLTAAERQVASMVAAGRTNRQTAAELFMGLRTVEAHLSAVYRKLGVRSRSELARQWSQQPE